MEMGFVYATDLCILMNFLFEMVLTHHYLNYCSYWEAEVLMAQIKPRESAP